MKSMIRRSIIVLLVMVFLLFSGCKQTPIELPSDTAPPTTPVETTTTKAVSETSPPETTEPPETTKPPETTEPPETSPPETTEGLPPETSEPEASRTTPSNTTTTTAGNQPTPTQTTPAPTQTTPAPTQTAPPPTQTTSAPVVSYLSNESIVRMPVASGTAASVKDKSVIDYSNTSDGYVMIQYTGGRAVFVIQIQTPNGKMYQYQLATGNSNYNAFPLTEGNGTYTITMYEGDSMAAMVPVDSLAVSASLSNANMPYLMSSYYVGYNAGSNVVAKAKELCANKTTEVEKISAIYNWFVTNVAYDYNKAATVQHPYTPVPDNTLAVKTGICFDYASAMAAMLRSQGIPCRVEDGVAGKAGGAMYVPRHAWITTYTVHTGEVNGWIKFDGANWTLMEPTFAASNGDSNTGFQAFVKDSTNYQMLFRY